LSNSIVEHEAQIRLAVFSGIFILLAFLEILAPRRTLTFAKSWRWFSNLGISVLNSVVLRLLLPAAGVGAAALADQQGLGVFNLVVWPLWISVPVFLLVFDVTIYWQHRIFHRIPWLWRLHRMHHTDPDYDLTTGNRFHPLEILLSGMIKVVLIVLMGPPVLAVILAEIILNASAMFNHSNLRLPLAMDRVLRQIIVTPDMHRVHHSIYPEEFNRNFGFNLSLWDRLFRSYCDQPRDGHEEMSIGIRGFQNDDATKMARMLAQPLKP